MTKLYWCACRCGCSTVIASKDNNGCSYCVANHQSYKTGIKPQFNPLTEIKND